MSTLQQIKKRNGDVVSFEVDKIERAIKSAFIAVTRDDKAPIAKHIADIVSRELELEIMTRENYLPTVEHTQDLVEKHIMEAGFFDVAKAYIIYRYERSKERVEKKKEDLEKLEDNALYITKKNGKRQVFDLEKVRKSVEYVAYGYEKEVNIDLIVNQVKLEVFGGMTTKDINKAVVMSVRTMIEQDPAYSYIASRLLIRQINEETIGAHIDYNKLDLAYREVFINGITSGVEKKILDVKMKDFDLVALSNAIVPKRDELFMYLGTQTLHERYLVRDVEGGGGIIENLQGFWMRIAMGVALNEKLQDRTVRAIEFYEVMSTMRFVPSSPTLFHAGTKHAQLSSCYLNVVEDSLENIFKVYADNAQLSKWAGGIGTSWSKIRASGALVKASGMQSNGIVPFLKIANDVTVAINRSGRRRGATAVYLENWHYDVEEFLDLRKNTGDDRRRTHDMNTANWISDLFMKRVREDAEWTLFSPDEVPELTETYGKIFEAHYIRYEALVETGEIKLFKKMKARDLWRKMITMLFETGHPWITWKDPSNIRSPQDHAGVVHNSNLCTEITLNNSIEETAVCNLGSLNYQRLMKNGKLDTDLVAKTTKTAVRMLDNVIDVNYYPTEEARVSNFRHRPIGLGIMGFHDALYMMDVNFDSDDAVMFADESMEFISYHAILSSSELAKERGAYESYKGSKWSRNIFPVDTLALLEEERGEVVDVTKTGKMDWSTVRAHVKAHGMRNSNTMAMAPTATISNIVGSVPCIEPIYKNIYVKANMNGDFIVVNPYLIQDLKALNLWDFEMIGLIKYHDGSVKDIPAVPQYLKEKYKEVFEIDPSWLIKSAAHRGKWVDQSQSLNIYFSGTSGRDLAGVYEYAWRMGLKTTYYLRTLSASQVEKSTVSTAEFGVTHRRGAEVGNSVSSDTAVSSAPAGASQSSSSAGNTSAEVSQFAHVITEPVLSNMIVEAPVTVNASPTVSTPSLSSNKPVYNITKMPESTCDGCQ